MTAYTERISPSLDKRIPAALVAAFLLQTAGALFWAGSAAQRISTLERTVADDQAAIERVAVMQEQIATIRTQLDRMENKLDRMDGEQPTRSSP